MVIVKGEALPSIAGRIDDFAWPPRRPPPRRQSRRRRPHPLAALAASRSRRRAAATCRDDKPRSDAGIEGELIQAALPASTSARTIAAPSTIAFILPKATSRGRYFMPQSGATTIFSAGT